MNAARAQELLVEHKGSLRAIVGDVGRARRHDADGARADDGAR